MVLLLLFVLFDVGVWWLCVWVCEWCVDARDGDVATRRRRGFGDVRVIDWVEIMYSVC